ncbi:hypothetical protein EDI_276460 [Entamoeba dispar SAW760]|uniref:Uncharacterized protein n=1 Tax=Entamoeba dispar (strain ATCC PRA-260 / SAW760) TaxID=370354 RepID=B0EDS2_ENTDS|nr:uncharacterized protein EDI_276460 [Entamoeba dispar SAW760]EDR27335.1 hypothetical protein EDI_276460 [Entamoeba dispar SAW760]|eukprot:EDR27335.1 hypothetical protein EDI_276460 [Entamoeba dispar SAW760]
MKWKEASFVHNEFNSNGIIIKMDNYIVGLTNKYGWNIHQNDVIEMKTIKRNGELIQIQSKEVNIITVKIEEDIINKEERQLFEKYLMIEYQMCDDIEWNENTVGSEISDEVIIRYGDSTNGPSILQHIEIKAKVIERYYHLNSLIGCIVQPHSPRNSSGCFVMNCKSQVIGLILFTDTRKNTTTIININLVINAIGNFNELVTDNSTGIYKIRSRNREGSCCGIKHWGEKTMFVTTSHLLENRYSPVEIINPITQQVIQGRILFYSWCFDLIVISAHTKMKIIAENKIKISLTNNSTKKHIGYPVNINNLKEVEGQICSTSLKGKELIHCTYCSIVDGMSGGGLIDNGKFIGMLQSCDNEFSYSLSSEIIDEIIKGIEQEKTEEEIQNEMMEYGILEESILGAGSYYSYRSY